MKSSCTDDAACGMSEYELVRLENIKNNEEYLRSIGLFKDDRSSTAIRDDKAKFPAVQRKRRTMKKSPDSPGDAVAIEPPEGRLTRSKRRVTDTLDSLNDMDRDLAGTGRRNRQLKYGRDGEEGTVWNADEVDDCEGTVVTRVSCSDLENFMMTMNSEHAEQLTSEVLQHTVYRCSYMSIAALKARLKNMTNVDKLIAFCYALHFMGLTQLSEACANKLAAKYRVLINLPQTTTSSSASNSNSASNSTSPSTSVNISEEEDTP